jgi:hypothetical protein
MVFTGIVKTTLEIPDDLFREMKAAAALRGIKLRDFVTDAIAGHLARLKSAESRRAIALRRRRNWRRVRLEESISLSKKRRSRLTQREKGIYWRGPEDQWLAIDKG